MYELEMDVYFGSTFAIPLAGEEITVFNTSTWMYRPLITTDHFKAITQNFSLLSATNSKQNKYKDEDINQSCVGPHSVVKTRPVREQYKMIWRAGFLMHVIYYKNT